MRLFLFSTSFLFFVSCLDSKLSTLDFTKLLVGFNQLTIETMKTDGINPVLATRIFLYPNLAAYEIMALKTENSKSLSGKLTEFPLVKPPEEEIYLELAALQAYYSVMLTLNYREDLLDDYYNTQIINQKKNYNQVQWDNSLAYGKSVAGQIIEWADKDRYKQTKGLPYYISDSKPGSWLPTPPEYRSALEPHWGTLRPLTIQNLEYFGKPFRIEYSEDPESPFFQLAKEVYDSSFALSEEQKSSALFWDDNPDLNNFKGHIPFPRRHINPTAHWFSIINQIILKENFSFEKTAQLYAFASIAFYDANLVCWQDKFESNLIRPVSYIQNLIDPDWMPLLVTPPFPEHTSGHSACSAACSTVLTHFLGDNYAFKDSTHFAVGLGVEEFSSLMDAAWAVSYSRFYGGIHYKTGIIQGTEQGISIGEHIIETIIE